MKKLYQKLLTLGMMSLLFFTTSHVMGQDLIISEVADPADDFSGRYVEIYNASGSTIDFGVTTYFLARYANANTTPATVQLTGTLAAGAAYTIANNAANFNTAYGATADLESGIVTGNGDDTYALYINGDESTGSLHDIYGEIGTDGTGQAWEYLDTRAVRVETSGTAKTVWDAADWTIDGTANLADMTPGTHTYVTPCTPPTTQASAPGATVDSDTQITVSWTRGNGTAGVVVLAKEGAAVDATPESGTTYVANAAFGTGDEVGTGNSVVYVGTGTSVAVTGLNLGTDYHFEVFEYNTTDVCYLTPGATTSATTTGNAIPELSSAATATAEITSDVVLTFSEAVNATDESGISITIDGVAATISSVAGINSDTWTLTLAETIKANSGDILISYDDTSGDLVDGGGAFVASFTDVAVTNNTTLNIVANLTEARAIAQGQDVEITGEVFVSFVGSGGDKVYVQDSGAGLLIDDNGTLTTAYNSGDGIVNLKGSLTDGTGVMELVPAVDPGVPNTTGNAITPIVVSIADYNANFDAYESRVLKFEEVTFATPGVAFDAGADNYTLTDGSDDLTWRDNDGDARFEGDMTIPYSRVDIVGLGAEFFGSSQIIPFSLSEGIQDVYAPVTDVAAATANITTSGFDVTIGFDEPAQVYYLVNTNATATQGDVLASTDFVEQLDPSAEATISLSGLTDNTQYYVHMVGIDVSDANAQATVTTIDATTLEIVFDETTTVEAADAPIGAATISSVAATAAVDAAEAFNFKVTDDAAADAVPTEISSLVIENANATAWTSLIAGASISDGVTSAAVTTITDGSLEFDFATPFVVANGASSTFTLSVWFNTAVEDGTLLQFTIPTTHQFVANTNGSAFVPTLGAAVTSAEHIIDVVASELVIANVPATAEVNTAFGFDVTAEDANGNVDLASRTLDLSTTATGVLGGTISSVAMTDGAVSFTDLTFDTEGAIVIDVTDGALNSSTSSIDVVAAITGTIFFSEYFEGSSNNKYVEIYNGTNTTIDLSTVELKQSNNGSGFDGHPTAPAAYSATLSGTLAPGDVYIVYNGDATLPEILAEGDVSYSYGDNPGDRVVAFNGDDAMGLFWNGTLVDLIGDPAVDPGSSWDVAGVAGATTNHTLVRKPTITSGNTTALGSFGTDAADSEWEVYDQDVVTYIGFFGEVTSPLITASTTDFNGDFGYVVNGNSSDATSYTVSAQNLTEDLVVAAPAGFELSTDMAFTSPVATLNLTPASGTVAETTIYVRFTPTAANGATYSGDITHTSAGAESISLAVSGIEGELTVSDIADIRSLSAGTLVKVKAIVTTPDYGFNNGQYYIQDETAGVNVFHGGNQGLVNSGDSVEIEGTIAIFNDLVEIEPTTVTVINSGNTLPAATSITEAALTVDNANQGTRVVIEGVTLDDASTWPVDPISAGSSLDVMATAGTTGFVINIDRGESFYDGSPVPSEPFTITGILTRAGANVLILPFFEGDIVETVVEPSVTVNATSLDFGTVEVNTNSTPQSFELTSMNLTEDVTIAASAGFQVSLAETTGFASSISATRDQSGEANYTVYVRFAPTVTGAVSGDITLTSSTASASIAVSGEGTDPVTTANEKALSGVKAFPNPTSDVLFVELANSEAFTYQMYNLDGRVILKGSSMVSKDINIAGVNAGVYILEVRQDDKVFRARIAKK